MENEKIEKAVETAKRLVVEPDESHTKDYIYTGKSVTSYKNAVNEVYSKETSDAINLMNGVIAEESKEANRMVNDALNMITLTPYDYAKIINMILNTTYKNEDFQAVVEKHVLAAREDVKKYIEETRYEKRKLTKAEEMRKELDEAKAAFEKLKQPKVGVECYTKPSFVERIKMFFRRHKK